MNKLITKGKGISFEDEDEPAASPAPVFEKPRTAIGAISASLAMGRGVEAENRVLKERLRGFEDARVVEMLDPKRVHPSRFANRHEIAFSGEAFLSLKAEIAGAGRNVQAIKVRPIKQVSDVQEFEIVFGHRRHRACLELGLPIAAVVEDMSDSELFSEMERENRDRADLSPWEQGRMYKRALDEKLYPSLRKLASAIGAQVGNVSTAVQLASLPDEVLAAFPSPLELQFRWALPLKTAIEANGVAVLEAAKELAASERKLPARDVLDRLTGVVASSGSVSELFWKDGRNVGAWTKDRKGNISIRIKGHVLKAAEEKQLLQTLKKLLT